MRTIIAIGLVSATLGLSEALAAQSACYQCHTNFPVGQQCRREAAGSALCWEDWQGCHVGPGGCKPETPEPLRLWSDRPLFDGTRALLVLGADADARTAKYCSSADIAIHEWISGSRVDPPTDAGR